MEIASQPAFVMSDDGRTIRFSDVGRRDLADTSDRIIGLVHPDVRHLVDVALKHHVRASRLVNAVTLIVKDAAQPMADRSAGCEVTSFLVSGDVARMVRTFGEPADRWCYRLLEYLLAQTKVISELHVVHRKPEPVAPARPVECDVILPHLGPEAYLRLSVDSLRRQTRSSRILVAVDQVDIGTDFFADVAHEPRVHVYQLSPSPVGPYVARHVLSRRSTAAYVAFQDTDDMSLPHRLATLSDVAERTGAGIVGSHELQVHQARRKVYAIRYPLDVNASLHRAGANHQLLLPTTLVRKEVIDRVGGFSTYRHFSLDVAFWLSASFDTKIVNADEFLYVRRRHPASLTMRPDIGTDSPIRRALVSRRREDFAAIEAGRLRIEDSSLAVRHREGPVAFRNVKTGEITMARFGYDRRGCA